MKTLFTSFVILTLVLLNSQFIYPQWVQTNGPGWGYINCLAASGSNIIANSQESGVFLSTDDGTSWLQINNGLTNSNIRSFVFSGTNIFTGTTGGVFLTTNNGTNWFQVNNGLTDTSINALVINGNNILAGSNNNGVFLSTNNGINWTQQNNGLTNTSMRSFAIDSTNIYAGTDSGGVFLSTNSGINWTSVNSGLPNSSSVTALTICGNNIFAVTGKVVFQSTNKGGTWSKSNLNQLPPSVVFLTASGTNIFAGSTGTPYGGDVYRSTNYGNDWKPVMGKGSIRALASSGNNLYASTFDSQDWAIAQGLFCSTNEGNNWNLVGLPISIVYSLVISGNNIIAGTFFSGAFLSTSCNGTNLIQVGMEAYTVNCLATSGNNIFAGTSGPGGHPGGVYLSPDNGITWTGINNGISITSAYILALSVSGSKIFAGYGGDHGGIYLSTNNGTNWSNIYFADNNKIYAIAASGNNILAGSSGGLLISTDDGTNWAQETNGLTNTAVNVLFPIGDNIIAGTDDGIFLSTDNGNNWTQLNNGLTNTSIHSFAISGINLFAGTIDGVFLSTNNGYSWTKVGMDNVTIQSLAINETYVLAGTNGIGLWYRPLADFDLPVELTSFTTSAGKGSIVLNWSTATELNNMGFDVERSGNKSNWGKVGFVKGNGNSTMPINYSYVDKSVSKAGKYYYRLKQVDNNGSFRYSNVAEVEFGAPLSYALNQNYPNPFNPSTMISYRLKEKGFVKLKVYGIKGELVKVLVNELKDAGYYESEFDGRGLASGVYIYRLEVIGDGNKVVYSDIKKTVLLK